MYYPNIAGYETDPQPAQQAATTQMQEQANPVNEYQQTESTLMTILPICRSVIPGRTRCKNVYALYHRKHS